MPTPSSFDVVQPHLWGTSTSPLDFLTDYFPGTPFYHFVGVTILTAVRDLTLVCAGICVSVCPFVIIRECSK